MLTDVHQTQYSITTLAVIAFLENAVCTLRHGSCNNYQLHFSLETFTNRWNLFLKGLEVEEIWDWRNTIKIYFVKLDDNHTSSKKKFFFLESLL